MVRNPAPACQRLGRGGDDPHLAGVAALGLEPRGFGLDLRRGQGGVGGLGVVEPGQCRGQFRTPGGDGRVGVVGTVALVGGREHRLHRVIVGLRDGVELVVVAAGAVHRQPVERGHHRRDDVVAVEVLGRQPISEQDALGRFDVFIDLHNPAAGDPTFFFLPPTKILSDLGRRNHDRLLAAAVAEIPGPLRFSPKPKVSDEKYDKNWERICKNRVIRHTRPHVVAVTPETQWNSEHATQDGWKTVGRQLGLSLERYLRESPRK
jgi:hypothetical protein